MVRLPNLLATRGGRLAGFFALYASEGLPQGFAATAVALEFKRMGMTAEAIGTFAATITLPWTWKWLMGPLIDNLHLRGFGRRKQWIAACQVGMLLTLVASLWCLPQVVAGADGARTFSGMAVFSAILVLHNVFAATQDVAIDALACSTLAEHERGLANGLMFAGAQAGATVGGSGVLFLKGVCGFATASLVVPLLLVAILAMVVLMIFENEVGHDANPATGEVAGHPSFARAAREIGGYFGLVLHTFFRTRRGFLGMILAILPFGGQALSLTVSNVLTPTLGMNDSEIATLGVVSSLVFTLCCAAGGLLSDRFGRRVTLAVFSMATLLPTLWMGWRLQAAGWTFPAGASADGTWPRHETLIVAWWWASMVYSVFQGLMYGIRTAYCMDLVDPRIAATHFTAYMALLNLVTVYSYWWEGKAITPLGDGGWGLTYLQVFVADAVLGALFLPLLPFVRPTPPDA